MPTLDELSIDQQIPTEKTDVGIEQEVQPEQSQGLNLDFSFLRAETGDGSIEDYLDHPMNFNKSSSVARMLRGATGLFGSLRLAVIDIVLGAFEFAKEGKAVN
jgi:hypothetical protein